MTEPNLDLRPLLDFISATERFDKAFETVIKPAIQSLRKHVLHIYTLTIAELEDYPENYQEDEVIVERIIYYSGKVRDIKKVLSNRQIRGEHIVDFGSGRKVSIKAEE